MVGSYSSPRGLFRVIILMGEAAIATPLLLLLLGLLLLLLLLRLHAVMIHATLAVDRVSVLAISHVIWGRDAITAQIRVALVVISIPATRGMIILVVVTIGAVSS